MPRLNEFLAQSNNVGRGRVAQAAAEEYLDRAGFKIVSRNWRCKAGEVDLVAFEGATLCFIEVKARANQNYGGAVAAVDRRKQLRISGAAALFLASCGHPGACRFDVLGLDRQEGGWQFTLIRGAFEAP